MNKCEQKDALCFLTKIKTHLMPTQVITPKFYRREDLTTIVRLRIASIALLFSLHGDITKLAGKYKVSRQFIYNLPEVLNQGDSKTI